MSRLILNKQSACFLGQVRYYTFLSTTCKGPMNFSIFLPERALKQKRCPVLFWLSGLTCTEDNFMVKAGAQRMADKLGLILVCPDTSPRQANIKGEGDSYDLGLGAGFYVDATEQPWAAHYQMYSFVSEELPLLIDAEFPTIPEAKGIFGHSMGGHGALVVGLRHQDRFKSISAFSPIAAPSTSPLGQKAFLAYLGDNKETWNRYDSSYLCRHIEKKMPILVYQGDKDHLLHSSLHPEKLIEAAHNFPLTLRMKAGYDHSYFFVATFIDEHLSYHAEILSIWS
jgi:S-formylglutathione hydrolase